MRAAHFTPRFPWRAHNTVRTVQYSLFVRGVPHPLPRPSCWEQLYCVALLSLPRPCKTTLDSAWGRHPQQRLTKSRARISQSIYLLLPKCFTQVRFERFEPLQYPLVCIIDPGFSDSQEFEFDISHWANSSSQVPACTVEPGTPDDVALIVNFDLLSIHFRSPADVVCANSFSKSSQIACRLQ